MYQPSMEWYTRHRCPACQAVNRTHHGNSLDDGTDGDIAICECWNCRCKYWLMDEDLAEDLYQGDMDNAVIQKGNP